MLNFTLEAYQEMVAHAQSELPNEACGYVAEKDGLVCRTFRLTNLDASPEHFSMDPKEQFAAIRAMRADGMKPKAVYHSHPSTPARMSEEDLRLLVDPSLVYVIISMAEETPVVRAFSIADGLKEEPVLVGERPHVL